MIAGNFVPRIYAVIFRTFFPCGGTLAFTLACALQWYLTMTQVMKSEKGKVFLYAIALTCGTASAQLVVAKLGFLAGNSNIAYFFHFAVLGFQGYMGWMAAVKEIKAGNTVKPPGAVKGESVIGNIVTAKAKVA